MEPLREKAGQIFIEELDEILEVIFFTDGEFKIGYVLNKE